MASIRVEYKDEQKIENPLVKHAEFLREHKSDFIAISSYILRLFDESKQNGVARIFEGFDTKAIFDFWETPSPEAMMQLSRDLNISKEQAAAFLLALKCYYTGNEVKPETLAKLNKDSRLLHTLNTQLAAKKIAWDYSGAEPCFILIDRSSLHLNLPAAPLSLPITPSFFKVLGGVVAGVVAGGYYFENHHKKLTVSLSWCNLPQVSMRNVDVAQSDYRGTNFSNAYFQRTAINFSKLFPEGVLTGALIEDVDFTQQDVQTYINSGHLQGVMFYLCKFTKEQQKAIQCYVLLELSKQPLLKVMHDYFMDWNVNHPKHVKKSPEFQKYLNALFFLGVTTQDELNARLARFNNGILKLSGRYRLEYEKLTEHTSTFHQVVTQLRQSVNRGAGLS